jgi:hypothetical protein
MGPLGATESKPSLLTLPNELFFEVASHLESFRDLNSLLRTSQFFHTLFNTQLYRRAVAADDIVREDIVAWVLSEYRVASPTLLLDNGLSVHQELWPQMLSRDMGHRLHLLRWICYNDDQERSVPLAWLLLERGADTELKDDHLRTVLHSTHSGLSRQLSDCHLFAGTWC